jgi:nitrate reductase (cytochrome), electron transfer subunit
MMKMRARLGTPLRRRLVWISGAVAAMALGILLVDSTLAPREAGAAGGFGGLTTDAPIPAEADVFRLTPADLAVPVGEVPREAARLRSLTSFRRLRAYPGAPPRVPHSLAAAEFRGTTCNNCHASGGFSGRFGAYAPITPHPEYGNCLQCHTADDGVVGVASGGGLFGGGDDVRPARPTARDFVAVDWRTTAWPRIGRRAMDGSPPIMPHSLEMRGNCLSCHAGPGAVAEIRTTHPERANCRQCHVPDVYGAEEAFTRPAVADRTGEGEADR